MTRLRTVTPLALALLLATGATPTTGGPRGLASAQEAPFPVEYYYKIRWGHFDEWMDLYRRNHYPVLEKLQERGEIVEMLAASPFHHAGEDTRWDFRFTIVWRDVETAHVRDRDIEAILDELYPDRKTFEAEEQRRFQLLEQHLDVPVVAYDLRAW